jgi:alanine dehydrogenase
VGAVLVPGAAAPKVLRREDLALMREGSVVVDISIDQGGCFETSRPTTHDDPTYVVDGVVHYCVTNMPGAVPRTSTFALNNAVLPFALELADKGHERALMENRHLRNGLNVFKGKLTNKPVADALGLAFNDRRGRTRPHFWRVLLRLRRRIGAHPGNAGEAPDVRRVRIFQV